jgi:pyridoxine 5-phosphate synthase
MTIYLGVNIDHVATLRQVRGKVPYPDPVQAALLAESAGADGITVHLREDRRHIQDQDVRLLKQSIKTRLNFEMAVTQEMVEFALKIRPAYCCFVPEKREELTTEGGLDVVKHFDKIKEYTALLQNHDIQVSLFIDPDTTQIQAAAETGAKLIELHTGAYAHASLDKTDHPGFHQELIKLQDSAKFADQLGLIVNAGHGLTYENVGAIAAIPEIYELNIGHCIVAQAIFHGLEKAVSDMKKIMLNAREGAK